MDISKFDYEIDPEITEYINSNNYETEKPRHEQYEDDEEGFDDYIIKPKTKKKINIVYYNENYYDRPPKMETYYIVYNNVEFVILAKKLGLLDEYKQIVLKNNGEFYNFEDEFFDSKDAEKVVEILKNKFKNNEWFIPILAKAVEKTLTERTLFDDLTFNLIKKQFFMLDEETLYEALTYLANK